MIFVIDDDPIHQKIVEIKFRKRGYTGIIKNFLEAEEALALLIEKSNSPDDIPDTILLDINMPVMDGWDFLNEYLKIQHNIRKAIKIFVVTSSVDTKDREIAERYNCIEGYITKPIPEEFISLLS